MKRKPSPLDPFCNPQSIALFGSMQENWFFGAGVIVGDLLKWNYPGDIYPIHPTAQSVYGVRVYKDLAQTPRVPELAVIVTSYKHVPGLLRQCGAKSVKAVVIVSDGFGEAGPEGKIRQEDVLRIAKSHSIRLMGPNTVGVFNAWDRFTTVPYDRGYDYEKPGRLSIITQTGMYSPQAVAWNEYEAGINKVIDLGNMSDIDETDCLEYLEKDDGTDVISLYMEHSRRPKTFLDRLKKVSRKKPVLCLMPGGSPGAAAAMASHTGSLAGNADLYRTFIRQSGALLVDEYEDLRDCATPFLRYPLPKGNRLGVLTFSGAIGIQCIDAAEENGLTLGALSAESRRKLVQASDTLGNHPVDVGPASATAGAGIFNLYKECFDILKDDENIDCLYINAYISHGLAPAYYEELLGYIGSCQAKPVVSWCYGPSRQGVVEFGKLAERCGIPFYSTTRKAVRALSYMAQYARWRALMDGGSGS
ncbi:MAG TPA: CoA-binding protein [Smithellaceae bacterium]|nr:CoA-binding protein [Smithellaceae bacterium]